MEPEPQERKKETTEKNKRGKLIKGEKGLGREGPGFLLRIWSRTEDGGVRGLGQM